MFHKPNDNVTSTDIEQCEANKKYKELKKFLMPFAQSKVASKHKKNLEENENTHTHTSARNIINNSSK